MINKNYYFSEQTESKKYFNLEDILLTKHIQNQTQQALKLFLVNIFKHIRQMCVSM